MMIGCVLVPETKTLVDGTKARTRSLAIQPQKVPAETPGTPNGPAEQSIRNLTTGKLAAYRKAVDKRRLVRRNVGPGKWVAKLKLDRADCFARVIRQKKVTGGNIGRYARGQQLVATPQRHATLFQPARRLKQHG